VTDESDDTPLPPPLAHHVADPTRAAPMLELEPPTDADKRLPLLGIDADELDADLSNELETRQIAKLDALDLAKIDAPPPTVPIELVDLVDGAERDPATPGDTEDELTNPRDLPRGMAQRGPQPVLEGALFAVLPADMRAGVLARFTRRMVTAGVVVIRQGETAHALIVVIQGRLQVRAERADGQVVTLGYVRPGEFIGEGALLARVPSPVQIVATETSELLALAPKDVYDVAGAFPAVWAELKDVAERRARDWDARFARR